MSKPIQLRLPPGVAGGRVVLLDARLADHTTFLDLRKAMVSSRLIAEEMPEPDPKPDSKPDSKRKKKDTEE